MQRQMRSHKPLFANMLQGRARKSAHNDNKEPFAVAWVAYQPVEYFNGLLAPRARSRGEAVG